MLTKKGDKFRSFANEVRHILHMQDHPNHDCLVCADSSQEEVNMVASVLSEKGISQQAFEQEMKTIADNFVFGPGWTNDDRSCSIFMEDFLSVCYKLLP